MMRCLVCNSEMLLIEAVQADANTLPGCQRHTFLCSSCHDVERRLVFTGVKTITAAARPDLYLPASFPREALRILGGER
jgi:23S rRNA G2445 N2-methylase RlmL